MTEKDNFPPAEDIPYQLPDGREILLTEKEYSALSFIQNSDNPVSRQKISRQLYPEYTNHPYHETYGIIDSLKNKFPSNLASVIKGKQQGFLYWQKPPTS